MRLDLMLINAIACPFGNKRRMIYLILSRNSRISILIWIVRWLFAQHQDFSISDSSNANTIFLDHDKTVLNNIQICRAHVAF